MSSGKWVGTPARATLSLCILALAWPLGLRADYFPERLGLRAFWDAGYTGKGVIIGIVDRGWVDTSRTGLGNGKVERFLRWQGLPDPGLDYPTGHESSVAEAAASATFGGRRGVAPGATLWSAGVFTHSSSPWITSPNPPFYGLMMFGRYGLDGRKPQVLNNSWNWNHDAALRFDGTTHVTYAADAVALRGAVVVVSANNWARQPEPPSDGWNVITVGATTTDGEGNYTELASWSNRGPSPTFFDPTADRCTVDIVAPGEYTPWGWGTSIAAPLVSGVAALLCQKGLARGWGSYALDPRVIKAVLLNSANKLPGWTNNASDQGGVLRTDQPLDWRFGAGQVDAAAAFSQFDAAVSVAGPVGPVGWTWGVIEDFADSTDFVFEAPLKAGADLTATLVWFMHRDVQGYQPAAADPFAGCRLEDYRLANLDLQLYAADDQGKATALVAESCSTADSVEHLRLAVPARGQYLLRVRRTGYAFWGPLDPLPTPQSYALAWRTTSSEILVTEGTWGDPNPAPSGGTVQCRVEAQDPSGGELTYLWTARPADDGAAEAGSFDDPTLSTPLWTAHKNTGDASLSFVLEVEITGEADLRRTVSYTQVVHRHCDLTGDGRVAPDDLAGFLASYSRAQAGQPGWDACADVNHDGL